MAGQRDLTSSWCTFGTVVSLIWLGFARIVIVGSIGATVGVIQIFVRLAVDWWRCDRRRGVPNRQSIVTAAFIEYFADVELDSTVAKDHLCTRARITATDDGKP